MRTQLTTVVFSRDRPSQLLLLLRSLDRASDRTLAELHVTVLVRITNRAYRRAYNRVRDLFPHVWFWEETDFRRQLLTLLTHPRYTHVLFLVDDTVFVRKFQWAAVWAELARPGRAGFSFRLGTNTTRCYTQQQPQSVPDYLADGSTMTWQWTKAEHDFGYPLEVSSSVLPLRFVWPALSLDWVAPNSFEVALQVVVQGWRARWRGDPRVPRWLSSFRESRALSIPANLCQQEYKNRHAPGAFTCGELLATFTRQRLEIDLDKLWGHTPTGAHEEVPWSFVPFRAKHPPLPSPAPSPYTDHQMRTL